MASVVKRTRKDGRASYHVKYRAGDGRVHWEHVPGDKSAAKARAREIDESLHRTGGRWTPPVPMKCGKLADEWIEHKRGTVSARQLGNLERTVRLVWKPAFAACDVAAVTWAQIDAEIAKQRRAGKSDNTIRNDLSAIRDMLSYALKRGLIPANPAIGHKISGGKRRKIVPPSRDQIARLMEHARGEALAALTVATVTGLRRGELFALRWQDVDFVARTIRVHATNHAGHVSEQTKTEAGERFVPLFESARKVLAARKLRTTYNRPEDFVFGSVVGTPMEPGNFVRREFKTAIERAGLPSFRFHDLRHFAVSELIAQGADIKLLQAIAGHASATVTLDTYGHLMNERISEAATKYDPLVRPAGRREVDTAKAAVVGDTG